MSSVKPLCKNTELNSIIIIMCLRVAAVQLMSHAVVA